MPPDPGTVGASAQRSCLPNSPCAAGSPTAGTAPLTWKVTADAWRHRVPCPGVDMTGSPGDRSVGTGVQTQRETLLLGPSATQRSWGLPCRAQDTWVFLLVLGLTPVAPSHPLIGTELVVGSRSDREVALLTHTSPPEAPGGWGPPTQYPGSAAVHGGHQGDGHGLEPPRGQQPPEAEKKLGRLEVYLGMARDPHAGDAVVLSSEGDPTGASGSTRFQTLPCRAQVDFGVLPLTLGANPQADCTP